jgi:exoribonuclease II
MANQNIGRDSLVLYKNKPARVREIGEKLEIELPEGELLRVRLKDVELLHVGPLESLNQLSHKDGEVKTAWELLQGTTTNLTDLAELVYGADTPAHAWAAWQLVDDGLYFRGTPQEINVCSPQEVEEEINTRQTKADEEEAWNNFMERVQSGQFSPEDRRFLREVEDLALGRRTNSRVLQAMGRSETSENAHALLLETGYWDVIQDPYPLRLEINTSTPDVPLADLPEEERKDLTGLLAFAIDDEGSHDPDDAISIEGERIWVHIADTAALIPPDSPADLEARARGTSIYLPEGIVPMLPSRAVQVLGMGLQDRSPALSFGIQLDNSGQIDDIEIVPSWVKVQRLTYVQADTLLETDPLKDIYKLAQKYQSRRRANGALFIDLPEVKLKVNDGQVQITPIPALRSRDLVREVMLMAGEAVARYAIQHEIPIPYATQESVNPTELPEGLAGLFALRRMLKRSQVSSIPGSHAGVGLDVYSRVTSPLRRYLDLVVHQQLRAYFRGEAILDNQALIERIGESEAISNTANRAEQLAERHWTLVYLLQHPDWEGEGILVEKRNQRGKVLIPELALEPQIHLREDLPLNSSVQLGVRGVDLPELEAYFYMKS